MQTIEKIMGLESLGNVVPKGYQYYPKLVTPREDLSLPSAYLKWYDIYSADATITSVQFAESRAFLATEVQRLKLSEELGFVMLHRAGSVLLLLLTT